MIHNIWSTVALQLFIVRLLFISLNDVQSVFGQDTTTEPIDGPPKVSAPNSRLHQRMGQTAILECSVTAYPAAIVMWIKDGFGIGPDPPKYTVETYDEGQNQHTVALKINDLQKQDFGEYVCMAQNIIGRDEARIILIEINPTTVTTQTLTTMTEIKTVPTVREVTASGTSSTQESSNRPQTSEKVDSGHIGEDDNSNSSYRHSAAWLTTALLSLLTLYFGP